MTKRASNEGAPAARGAPSAVSGATGAVALAVAVAAAFALALQPLWATDLGWQLRAGREILAHGIPRVDDLSWSMPGAPWIELRWVWLAAYAALERAGGSAAMSWFVAALVGLAFALAGWTARGVQARAWAAPAVVAASLAAHSRFLARPETATFVLVAAFVFVLHRAGRTRAAWVLVPLQVLWVNTHTLFALGPALVAAWAAAGGIERRGTLRRDLVLVGATLAACLANPYGAGAFGFAWTIWTELHAPVVRGAIVELAGPFDAGFDFASQAWFAGLLVAAPLALAAAFARARRVDAFLLFAAAGGAFLALTSVRNLPLFAIPAIPLLAHHLALATAGRFGPPLARGAALVGALFALVTIGELGSGTYYARRGDPRAFGAGLAPGRDLESTAARLHARGEDGRVFAPFQEASWLLPHGVASWCDPRIEVFGPAHLARTLRAQADPAAWTALVREVKPSAAVSGLHDAAFHRVLETTAWELAWFDDRSAVFLPPGSPALAARDAVLETHAHLWPPAALARGARDAVGSFLLGRGRPDLARPYLEGATSPRMRLNLAETLEALGDAAAAGRERAAAFRDAPSDPVVATAWALELLATRGPAAADEAARALDRVLGRRDAPARAWALRGETHAAQGELAEAERCLTRAATLDPADAQVARRLAAIRAARAARSSVEQPVNPR